MKKYIIGMSLIAAPSMVHADIWQLFDDLLKELVKMQQASSASHATIDQFCNQLAHDLKGIPQTDIDAIVRMTKEKLRIESSYRTITTDVATQYAKSAIIQRYNENVITLIYDLYKSEDRPKAIESQNSNIHARLQSIPHINGESLAQFFDPQTVKNRITADAHYKYNTHNQSPYTQQPTYTPAYNNAYQPVSSTPSYFSIDGFCTQLTYDLKAMPQKDINAIVQKTKYQLQNVNRNNPITADIAMQYTKSVIAQYYQEVCTPGIEKEYNSEDRTKAKESRYNNMHAFLSGHSINDPKLASFFDSKEIEQSIKKEAHHKYGKSNNQQHTSGSQTSHYTPPVQQKPVVPTSTRTSIQDCSYNTKNTHTIDEVQRTHDAELARIGMPENDRHDYRIYYRDQCDNKGLSAEALIQCSKKQIRRVLIENLNNKKSELEPKLKNKTALRKVIEDLPAFIHRAVPDNAQPFDANLIKKYIGESMKATIIEQLDPSINCVFCSGEYKDEFEDGEAEIKVNIPCNNGHSICNKCKYNIDKCPFCSVPFTKEQMKKNAQRAEQEFAANNQK
ncbi:MAG TPA: hypothetical protein VGW78_07140 [Candidatus Babeliales bacterium]|jgi:hypothetical protein|nr:hypothetical protein [Candidatus Babeliales bacterium]